MTQLSRPDEPTRVWQALLTVTSGVVLLLLCESLWRTPYGISETVALLEDVDRNSPWQFFGLQGVYIRPLFYATLWGVWHAAGSLQAALPWFTALHVASVAGLVCLFIVRLKPTSPIGAAAAMIAVAVLVGSAAFRENLENLPLNHMMLVMVLALVVWSLLERPSRWWHAPAILLLTIAAIGFKEQGVLIAPIVAVAWWMGAPGVGAWTAAASTGVTATYLLLRLWYSPSWPLFPQDVGYGAEMLPVSEAAARFGTFPLPIFAYSVFSGIGSVLFAEPTAGVFRVVPHLLQGQVEPWEINNVVSSSCVTGLAAWWGWSVLRRDANRAWSAEARLCLATLLALAGSALIGFSYTRERMTGVALVFYAITAFHALRAAGERAAHASGVPLVASGLLLMLLGASWQVRAVGTIEYSRETASRNQREWIVGLQGRRLDFADRPVYLRTLEAMVEQGTNAPVAGRTVYPRWLVRLLGER